MRVKRYHFDYFDGGVIEPDEDGEWVRYEDHASEVERLRKERDLLLHFATTGVLVESQVDPNDERVQAGTKLLLQLMGRDSERPDKE